MLIRVSEIPEEGLRLRRAEELGGVFREEGWSLDDVDLTIHQQAGQVTVVGRFRATARVLCSRCLEVLTPAVALEVDLLLQPCPTGRQEEVELGVEDLEVDFYRGDVLDVGELLRSETHLALPMKPLCRPGCLGLCPTCGANRNLGGCGCPGRQPDPRWARLREFRPRVGDS